MTAQQEDRISPLIDSINDIAAQHAGEVFVVRWQEHGKPRQQGEYAAVETARAMFEAKRRRFTSGEATGWCSLSCGGFLLDHAQTPGYVREVRP